MHYLSPIFTYRRLLGHKIFHLFMKYFSVIYSCRSSPRRKQNAARTVLQKFCPEMRMCRCYDVNQYNKSTYECIRAHRSFHNVWHRPYDPQTRNTCAISWSQREDDDGTTDDDDDDCTISISWISYSLTEIWSRTLSNIRLRDNHLERVYNSPRIFILPAAANCDSLTGVTKICHKELSLKGSSPSDPVW